MILKPIAERILEVDDYYEEAEAEELSGQFSGVFAYIIGLATALGLVALGAIMAFAYLGVPLSEVISGQAQVMVSQDTVREGVLSRDAGIMEPRASEKAGRAN